MSDRDIAGGYRKLLNDLAAVGIGESAGSEGGGGPVFSFVKEAPDGISDMELADWLRRIGRAGEATPSRVAAMRRYRKASGNALAYVAPIAAEFGIAPETAPTGTPAGGRPRPPLLPQPTPEPPAVAVPGYASEAALEEAAMWFISAAKVRGATFNLGGKAYAYRQAISSSDIVAGDGVALARNGGKAGRYLKPGHPRVCAHESRARIEARIAGLAAKSVTGEWVADKKTGERRWAAYRASISLAGNAACPCPVPVMALDVDYSPALDPDGVGRAARDALFAAAQSAGLAGYRSSSGNGGHLLATLDLADFRKRFASGGLQVTGLALPGDPPGLSADWFLPVRCG